MRSERELSFLDSVNYVLQHRVDFTVCTLQTHQGKSKHFRHLLFKASFFSNVVNMES